MPPFERTVLEHMRPPRSLPRAVLPSRLDRVLRALDVMGVLVCEFDVTGRLVYVSPSVESMLGRTPEQCLADGIEFHPEDLPAIINAGNHVRETGEPGRSEARGRHRDGRWIWFDTTLLAWRASENDEFHTVSVSRDVTALKDAEAARRESEERYRVVSEMSCDLIFELDESGRQLYVGPTATELLGYTPEETLALEPWSLIHPDDSGRIRDQLEAEFRQTSDDGTSGSLRSRRRLMEYRLRHRDGRWIWFETFGLTYRRADGQRRFLAVSRDVTERVDAERRRRELEVTVQRAQKLEGLGVMAGGIAHDFNNILTPILGAASLALRDLPEDSPVCAHVERIERAAHRAAALTSQMLAYAGQATLRVVRVDVSEVVADMRDLLSSAISGKATLDLRLASGLPAVDAEKTQLGQVVMNLVTNAAEALAHGVGEIEVRTGVAFLDDVPTSGLFAESIEPGPYVFVEVADEGCGIDAETRARIFDPFFTTKFAGRGLGLAAVAGIVRAHRGAITVDSEPGRGTRFRVLLPVADGEPPPAPAPEPVVDGWRTSGTALVIDDEDDVRELAEEVLRDAGMNVLTASDGHEGVKIFEDNVDRIRLVLLDRTMPALSGIEACEALRARSPDVRIVLVSGYSEEQVAAELEGLGISGVVGKPFLPETLLAAVEAAIDGPPPARPRRSPRGSP